MNAYFAIISHSDRPLFEAEFFRPDYLAKLENDKHLHQFIVHAALDMVESMQWGQASNHLKVVDRYGDWIVSAFISPDGARFMLLHDAAGATTKGDESIRTFLNEANELYTRVTLDPFYLADSPIASTAFLVKVRMLGKKFLEK